MKNTSSHVFGFMPPQNGFFKSHQMTKVCHNHALPLYLLVFCKICTRIYCDFVPVICVLFVTCKLCTFMFWKFCYLGGVIVRGVFVLGGNCPGGNCPGVIVRGVIVRGVIVLEPSFPVRVHC